MAASSNSVAIDIVAHSGGGISAATALTKQFNVIGTCAADGDSVLLPPLVVGQDIFVRNEGAYPLAVFPPSAAIDEESAASSVKVQPGYTVKFSASSVTAYKADIPATESVSQATSITTGVTLDAIKGLITTMTATNAADLAATFTVTNKFARSGSHIHAYIVNYSGTIVTNGNPQVIVKNRTNGTFDIVITNTHSSNALNGTLVIGFKIEN